MSLTVRWTVPDPAGALMLYDVQKVYRSVVGAPYTWVEITDPVTRVALVGGTLSYSFVDATGSTAYYYAYAYYNSVTTAESSKSAPFMAGSQGYATVEEVRAEGYNNPPHTDARVEAAIQQATRLIDRVTGQWFEPRYRTFRLDVPNDTLEFLLDVPIIALDTIQFWDEIIELADVWVYNRHLTQGIQEDLLDPRIVFQRDWVTERERKLYGFNRNWTESNQRVALSGWFGYTELPLGVEPGETASESQIPTHYGETPIDIKRATLLLMQRFLPTIASGDGLSATMDARVTGIKTQDQSLTLAAPSGTDASYGVTGILEVDTILAGYMGPMRAGAV